jgi:hypothetical protein
VPSVPLDLLEGYTDHKVTYKTGDLGRVAYPDVFEAWVCTVRLRGMGTEPMGTILTFASGVPRKMETLLLGSWWP